MRNGYRSGLALVIGIALLGPTAQTSVATPVAPEILDRIGPQVINPGLRNRGLVEMGRHLGAGAAVEVFQGREPGRRQVAGQMVTAGDSVDCCEDRVEIGPFLGETVRYLEWRRHDSRG